MGYINNHKDSTFYICKRLRLLEYLKKQGFLPIRTEPDIHNPKYSVWIFNNTEDLADAIDEWLTIQQNRKV